MNSDFSDWKSGKPLKASSDRFLIRSLNSQDATERYIGWWNNPKVQEGLNMPARNWNRTNAAQHIMKFDNVTSFHLGIFPKEEALPIGFFAIFFQPKVKIATTNIVIGELDWWGKQVPREVRAFLLPFIFIKLGAEKIKGVVHGRNLPSIFNYETLGFTSEGVLRSEEIGLDGKRIDVYQFGFLKGEWEKRHES